MARAPIRTSLILSLAGLLALAPAALAHRVNVFAYVEGETVHVECAYSRSQPVLFGEVEVRNGATGKVYLTGKTDDKGQFAFTVPPQARSEKADLNLLLRAGEGHQNEWTVKAGEYLAGAQSFPVADVAPDAKPKPSPAALTVNKAAKSAAAAPVAASQPAPCVPDPALAPLVEAAVEKKIAPIRHMLVETQVRGPGITEIIGGIGYLVGMAGLLAYARSRKRGGS